MSLYKKCFSKKKYLNIDEAMISGKFRDIQLYTYLCKNCNHWHLTKKETIYKVI
jgi:uncharacterized protein YlaI